MAYYSEKQPEAAQQPPAAHAHAQGHSGSAESHQHDFAASPYVPNPQPGVPTASNSDRFARDRLPTLAEVLARRTQAPVDLYCLYLFLQREGAEDALDFWLDVQQHENLCRAYFKDLRRSGRSVRADWPAYAQQARLSGSIYNRVNGLDEEDEEEDEGEGGDRLGQEGEFGQRKERRFDSELGEKRNAEEEATYHRRRSQEASTNGRGVGSRFPGDPDFLSPNSGASPRDSDMHQQQAASQNPNQRRSLLSKRASLAPTIISRNAAITRIDLTASAERIYARYLLPGSEKEIFLPATLRIASFPLSSSTQLPHPHDEEAQLALARVPDMFHAQKEYVFRTMEADIFPRFLRAKAFGNLTPISSLLRLSLGLLSLWAALSTGFAFIFLAVARPERCWVILPFSVAAYLLLAHQYELDPLLLLLAGKSETTPFKHIAVREPYVRALLRKRAAGVLIFVTILAAALSVLFIFVPGHRL